MRSAPWGPVLGAAHPQEPGTLQCGALRGNTIYFWCIFLKMHSGELNLNSSIYNSSSYIRYEAKTKLSLASGMGPGEDRIVGKHLPRQVAQLLLGKRGQESVKILPCLLMWGYYFLASQPHTNFTLRWCLAYMGCKIPPHMELLKTFHMD